MDLCAIPKKRVPGLLLEVETALKVRKNTFHGRVEHVISKISPEITKTKSFVLELFEHSGTFTIFIKS